MHARGGGTRARKHAAKAAWWACVVIGIELLEEMCIGYDHSSLA